VHSSGAADFGFDFSLPAAPPSRQNSTSNNPFPSGKANSGGGFHGDFDDFPSQAPPPRQQSFSSSSSKLAPPVADFDSFLPPVAVLTPTPSSSGHHQHHSHQQSNDLLDTSFSSSSQQQQPRKSNPMELLSLYDQPNFGPSSQSGSGKPPVMLGMSSPGYNAGSNISGLSYNGPQGGGGMMMAPNSGGKRPSSTMGGGGGMGMGGMGGQGMPPPQNPFGASHHQQQQPMMMMGSPNFTGSMMTGGPMGGGMGGMGGQQGGMNPSNFTSPYNSRPPSGNYSQPSPVPSYQANNSLKTNPNAMKPNYSKPSDPFDSLNMLGGKR
jgi:hypothetical protein